jgi:hypothetical protein
MTFNKFTHEKSKELTYESKQYTLYKNYMKRNSDFHLPPTKKKAGKKIRVRYRKTEFTKFF